MKTDFLEQLESMSKEDIDKLIKQNGKPPKPIIPVIFIDKQ